MLIIMVYCNVCLFFLIKRSETTLVDHPLVIYYICIMFIYIFVLFICR